MSYFCKYCNREINNRGSCASHEYVCRENPDRVKRTRAPDAGAKKGSIPWNKGKHPPLTKYHKSIRRPDEEVFVENSTYARNLIRKRILKKELIDYHCAICRIGPKWNNKPMPLILDHVNGVNNDHRIKNLRFVCSNCDTQLSTYKSRNKESVRLVEDAVLKTVGR